MKNFDLSGFFYGLIKEQGEEEVAQQPEQPQQPPQQKALTPNDRQNMTSKTPFDALKELTVENVEFVPATNGGSLKIKFKENARPFIFAFQNNQSSLQNPNGEVIKLT